MHKRFMAWIHSLFNSRVNIFYTNPNTTILANLLIGSYRKGKRVGDWTWYDEDGHKIKETRYSDNGEEIYSWYA